MVRDYVEVKHGRQKAEYIHPVCEKILSETNGVMVYQEQVMRILNELGGIELAASYTCIKAISKKKEDLIAKNREQFVKGCLEKGLSEQQAIDFWTMIIKFAGYGFNKSHSTAYALIAYMTAYLKAHYPVEFMAALLSGDIPGRNFKSKDALVEHMEDCERMNIPVEPANVNTSGVDFTVGDGKIFFGLSAVKGCGGSAGEAIVAAREKGGPFKDIFDFCERVDITQCGRGSMETLIKAGAMDSFGARRAQLSAVLDRALQAGQSAAADRKSGQKNLFGAFAEEEAKQPAKVVLPDLPEWPERDKLQAEKEVLGFYLTAHPLDEYRQTLQMYCSHTTASVPDVPDRAEIILGGMVGAIKHAHTKNGKPGAPTKYANFDFEDVDGVIRSICWPDGFATMGHLIVPEAILVMRGVVDRRGGDEANIIVNELIPLNELAARYTSGVKVRANIEQHGLDILPRIYEVARAYPGSGKFKLVLALDDGSTVYFGESRKLRVDANEEFRARIDNLLGPGNLQLMVDKPKPQAAQPRREFRRAPAGAQ
jgi:DNA polymerase-3 subunit alpha